MYDQASVFRKNGHEVYFFATNKKPYFEEDYAYNRFFSEYTDYKSLDMRSSLKYLLKPFYNYEARDKLDNFLDIKRPDIIHCHNICYHLTPSIFEPCKKRKIPIVMTLNDPRLMCPGGTLLFKNSTYCHEQYCISGSSLHCLINKCRNNSLKASFIATAENLFNRIKRFYDSVDVFVCPSNAMRDLAINSGIDPDRLIVLNNFIPETISSAKPEYGNKGYFLYTGRLAAEKKVDHLIEAVSMLPEIKLHIAGTGPEEENLKKLTRELNAFNVKFWGFLSGKQLEQEYKNCIATVLPCDWFETFGLTIIESYAYGKPVIASRIGAIPELVENYKNGILFDPGNIKELASAINRLYTDKHLVAEIGKFNRNQALDLYTLEAHYQNLFSIYKSAVSFNNFKFLFQLKN